MGMLEQAEKMAVAVEAVAEGYSQGLSKSELLSLLTGAALLRMVSPMRLSRAIETGRKKFESLNTEVESNQKKTRG